MEGYKRYLVIAMILQFYHILLVTWFAYQTGPLFFYPLQAWDEAKWAKNMWESGISVVHGLWQPNAHAHKTCYYVIGKLAMLHSSSYAFAEMSLLNTKAPVVIDLEWATWFNL